MKCVICKQGETLSGSATVTLMRENMVLVVKGVPADVCDNCGEEYVSEDAAEKLLGLADAAAQAGVHRSPGIRSGVAARASRKGLLGEVEMKEGLEVVGEARELNFDGDGRIIGV